MAVHLLHKGGPGNGKNATYSRSHFPQVLPQKKATFQDSNSAKDGRNTRWLNLTGKNNWRHYEYADVDGQALQQYMSDNEIVEGDRIVTHFIPMQHKLDYIDIENMLPVNGAQVSIHVLDIDDLSGPPALTLMTGIDLTLGIELPGVNAAAQNEQDGYTFIDVKAVNGNVPYVTRWNWALAIQLDALGGNAASDIHLNITPFMDYVHQVEH